MRALLIGLGGAGCRIVDTLNQHDERSGVRSVHSFVFDADKEMISEMASIPREDRFILTPIDPVKTEHEKGTDFEVGNLASCFQRDGIAEIDAVFVCAGLGGRMAELVPVVVSQLNTAFADPIFTILTLPGRNEGVKVSARASETLKDIREVAQATILFDNETWFKRIEEEEELGSTDIKRKATIYEMYPLLNEMLARRVGLLLRAGEFNHKGVDAAEVVLDAGEVLNTLKSMDLVAIGYATEKLPSAWSGVMKKIRVEKYMLEENQTRTSRIVELAKRAVYREVSVPCDLTSANKALVLIAGPSDELSMKGFQTVRKWIDRSIKGLEMRAGDYPVKSTQYVGVIIVLAGIENVPRVTELDEIHEIYEAEQHKVYPGVQEENLVEEIQVAEDEVLFEDSMVMAIGTRRAEVPENHEEEEEDIFEVDELCVSPAQSQEIGADIFSEDVYTPQPRSAEDVFEERVITPQYRSYIPQQSSEDVFEETVRVVPPPPQYIPPQRTAAETIFGDQTHEILPERKTPAKAKPKELPKVVINGPKKAPQMTGSTIMMPKRERKVDNVLAGMADVGGKDKPKDSDSVLSGMAKVGGNGKPKETITSGVLEGAVNVGGAGKPKETDGVVKPGGGQRPKETDGHIRMTGSQRPKETDGHVRMTGSQRPKETDGHIRMTGAQRPKETDGVIRGGSAQRPAKEIGDTKIRVTSTPLPKNPAVKPIAEKKEKNKWT